MALKDDDFVKREDGLKVEIAEVLAKYELRTGRGLGLIGLIADPIRDIFQGGLWLFAARGLSIVLPFQWISDLIMWIPPLIIIPIAFGKKAFEYWLGWKDEKVGYWKFKNDYLARKINPYFTELLDRVVHIEEMLKKKNG